jgi:hypothetical protein
MLCFLSVFLNPSVFSVINCILHFKSRKAFDEKTV